MKRGIKIPVKTIVKFIILAWSLAFSHSELGLCTEKESFPSHDYCRIIDGAITQINKNINNHQLDIKTICPHSDFYENKINIHSYGINSTALLSLIRSTDIYLNHKKLII